MWHLLAFIDSISRQKLFICLKKARLDINRKHAQCLFFWEICFWSFIILIWPSLKAKWISFFSLFSFISSYSFFLFCTFYHEVKCFKQMTLNVLLWVKGKSGRRKKEIWVCDWVSESKCNHNLPQILNFILPLQFCKWVCYLFFKFHFIYC